MSDNLTMIKEEYEKYKGQFVLSHDRVYRFLGLIDDGFDYYYCLYDGRKLFLHSCVGRLTPLKGYILEDHYKELVRIAKLNHWDILLGDSHKFECLGAFDPENEWIVGPDWEMN